HIPSASLWAAVPHYVAATPSPKAALALVQRAVGLLSTPVLTTDLEIAAAAYERQVSEVVASDDDVSAYVERLEGESDDGPLGADPEGHERHTGIGEHGGEGAQQVGHAGDAVGVHRRVHAQGAVDQVGRPDRGQRLGALHVHARVIGGLPRLPERHRLTHAPP